MNNLNQPEKNLNQSKFKDPKITVLYQLPIPTTEILNPSNYNNNNNNNNYNNKNNNNNQNNNNNNNNKNNNNYSNKNRHSEKEKKKPFAWIFTISVFISKHKIPKIINPGISNPLKNMSNFLSRKSKGNNNYFF